MTAPTPIGQFLALEDVNQAALLAGLCLQNLTKNDEETIRNIIRNNWDDEEQMVSNLLQSPFLIPDEIKLKTLTHGLAENEIPYYILSACVGIQRIKLKNEDVDSVKKLLKGAVFNEHGAICMRAFITLNSYLKLPEDVGLFIDIFKTKKSPLHDSALSWLVLHVNDKKELLRILNEGDVCQSIISKAENKMDDHCESLAHGEESPISIEVFDYIPNLVDFEAMLDKEDALAEFFDDLDTDHDEKLSANEVQNFLEDIGKEVSIDDVIKEMKNIGIDDSGKIDRDGFIEMMFPKFQIR